MPEPVPEGLAPGAQVTALERHAQTALTVLLVAILSWVGFTTQGTQVKVAELAVEVKNLKGTFSAPQKRVDDLTRRIEIIETAVLDKHDHDQ